MTGASAGVVPALATPRWLDSVPVVIAVAVVVIDVALRLAVLGIIPSNRKPSSAMAWILLILLIPVPGIALFLLLGSTRVGRRRHAQQAEVNTLIRRHTADVATLQDATAPSYVGSVATLNRNLGALPALGGNSVELLADYRGSIAAMAAEVDGARALRARGVLHHRLGRGDRPVLRGPGARPPSVAWRCGCCSTTWDPGASRATRRCSNVSPGPRSSGIPMLPIHVLRGSSGGPTCATTARSWWSTGRRPSSARRT